MTRALPSRTASNACRLLVCLLLGTLLSLSAAPAQAAVPEGNFDSAPTPSPQTVVANGWAFDPAAPPAALEVRVYIGGPFDDPNAERHTIQANRSRPDVKAAYGTTYPTVGEFHGFSERITTLKSGPQPVHVYAIGLDGSVRTLGSKAVVIPADTTPPDTVITMGPAADLTPGPVFFEFTSTEPGTFQCAMDGGGRFPCESPYAATVTAAGPHTFTVAGVDLFGNADPAPATYGFNIVTPPAMPGEVSAKAVSRKGKLRVDVSPDWSFGNYELTVQKLRSGSWKTVRRSSTRGTADARTMDLRAGRYRVLTSPANGLAAAVSGTVRLRR